MNGVIGVSKTVYDGVSVSTSTGACSCFVCPTIFSFKFSSRALRINYDVSAKLGFFLYCYSLSENLYDVFLNIRDDEAEHCKTMKACQTHGTLRSPHSNPEDAFEDDSGCVLPQADCEGIVDCIKKSVAPSQTQG